MGLSSDKKKMKTDKKKRKINKEKLASPSINRIWSGQDELFVLKGLVEFKAKIGFITKVEWDAFHTFVEDSILDKFSKAQILSKINKLKWKYLSQSEKIQQGIDTNFATFTDFEAFKLAMLIWGKNEGESGQVMLEENGEPSDNNGALNITESETVLKVQQSESGEGLLKENNEAADKTLNDNGGGNESHEAEDKFGSVKDAFETLISHGLSDYQKRLQLEKLMKLEGGIKRKLADEWKTICAKERNLNIKKLKFSAKIEEATN